MAAATENARVESVFGNLRIVLADLTFASSADTYACGLSTVHGASWTPKATDSEAGGLAASAGTITYTGSAAQRGWAIIIGEE